MFAEQGYALSEMDRRLRQLIRIGIVYAVDHKNAKVKVKIGENATDWRPWIAGAGGIKTWNPPVLNEQVLVLSPSGDFEQSIILPALYYTAFQAPSDQHEERCIALSDTARTVWNTKTQKLHIQLDAEGALDCELGDTALHFDAQTIQLQHKKHHVEIGANGIHLAAPGASIALKDRAITLQAGAQTLELNAVGVFLNGAPVHGVPAR